MIRATAHSSRKSPSPVLPESVPRFTDPESATLLLWIGNSKLRFVWTIAETPSCGELMGNAKLRPGKRMKRQMQGVKKTIGMINNEKATSAREEK